MRSRGLIWPLLGLVGLLAARRWLDVVEVRGRSMAPALLPGDRLLVARLGTLRVGDVVLASDPRDARRELVKRVSRLDATNVTLRGDNAAASTDARTFGMLPRSAVRWRVIGRYWPTERIGPVPLAARIEPSEDGGEPACAFPDALVAGIQALSLGCS
jgi:nickel-type superoxide dismutase maturation protease